MHFLIVTLIAVSANSNSGKYIMVIISNATIGGIIIPNIISNRKVDSITEIRHYGFKGHNSCYCRCA